MTWRERVLEAKERGEFLSEERRLADSWNTCAVGEQQQVHPLVVVYTDRDKIPLDKTLYALGGLDGFCGAVLQDDFEKADNLLEQIEDRVLELKRGL